jgi:hypothetical protein
MLCLSFALPVAAAAGPGPAHELKLLAPAGYLPAVPVLVRVELRGADGARDKNLWDTEITLGTDNPAVTLSTNRLTLKHGLGSTLVTFSGGGDFTLVASAGVTRATRPLASLAQAPVMMAGGTLSGTGTTWRGVVQVTNDVTVPTGHTLTIEAGTWVLLKGVATGTAGTSLRVNGALQSLGTEDQPVSITCADAALRWGQIRHDSAKLSTPTSNLYRHTFITRGGRAPTEGHTGTGPVIRPTNSKLRFESCVISDLAETVRGATGFGTPGKVMLAKGCELVFDNCLLGRARMGPEITGSSLLCTNTWMLDMRGPDDADGFYIHDQAENQEVLFAGCVIAGGDDDGLDTLGSFITVRDCIIRDWNNLFEDAKGISVFNGATHVRHCLIAGCTVGVSAKWSSGPATLVTIDRSTITGVTNAVLANRKSNAPGPFIDYRITNSILLGPAAVFSDFAPTNFTVRFTHTSQPWPGLGNTSGDALLADEVNAGYHLRPYSPAIDSGSPEAPADPDGSPADRGYFTFIPPPPRLGDPRLLTDGSFQLQVEAYTNRNYLIETSTNAVTWEPLKTVWQGVQATGISDTGVVPTPRRFYRARWPF